MESSNITHMNDLLTEKTEKQQSGNDVTYIITLWKSKVSLRLKCNEILGHSGMFLLLNDLTIISFSGLRNSHVIRDN